jgi:mannitol operon repressor
MGKRTLQTIPNLTDDVSRLVDDLERESDRGAALVGAAFLDDVLDVLLRSAFVNEPETVGKLMGMGRPLESFGSRAHLCYCMGLLGADVYADINLIREIRNDFAHRGPTGFDLPDVEIKCMRLRIISTLGADESCGPRERFIATVVMLANHLLLEASRRKHAAPAKKFAENGVLRVR